MRDSTISTPRIDVNFVDSKGRLTQSAYALLYGLIERVGGIVAPIIDVSEIIALMDEAAVPSDVVGRSAMVEAEELRQELSSVRCDVQRLYAVIDEMAAEIASMRVAPDFRARIEQIEDRLN